MMLQNEAYLKIGVRITSCNFFKRVINNKTVSNIKVALQTVNIPNASYLRIQNTLQAKSAEKK